MKVRVNEPDVSTAQLGGIYVIRYAKAITIEHATLVHRDYLDCCAATEPPGPMAILMLVEEPLPMPPSAVRRYWRAEARAEPGFGPISLVAKSLSGLMISAAMHLARQLITLIGGNIRIFWDIDSGCEWLLEQSQSELAADELIALANELEAIS